MTQLNEKRMIFTALPTILSALLVAGCVSWAMARQDGGSATSQPEAPSPDAWREAERPFLTNHVQLTTSAEYLRAGESYFSPDDSQIIFQAIATPKGDEAPEANYQMYVADVVRNDVGRITGIANTKRLSPQGSSNTCGWFHPTKPGVVIFGTTLVEPDMSGEKSGYQRSSSKYVWQFPREMTIVECDLRVADATAATLTPLVQDSDAYLAECVISPDGRHLVYCRREVRDGRQGGDLVIRDLKTGEDVLVAGHSGYDGGPFFSPDGERLCYRSDREGNDLLQIFVAELSFDDSGHCTGLDREFQLTENGHVNWAPFWHPNGRFLVYATSEMGHRNYEVFILDADAGTQGPEGRPARYGTRGRRVTHAAGFDGLPAFNRDGSVMMWTGQRDEDGTSQLYLADFVMDIDPEPSMRSYEHSH